MNPWKKLDEATGPDGKRFVLAERSGEVAIRVGAITLMSSRAHHSEEVMARVVCEKLSGESPKVLIGGLGFGFTLRAALDSLPPGARVEVAEILGPVIGWNKTKLANLAGRPLEDPRVELVEKDVAGVLKSAKSTYDAILLDVDNGPEPLSQQANKALYSPRGLAQAHRALARGGIFSVWSVSQDEAFRGRLAAAGFAVEVHRAPAFASLTGAARGKMHVIYVGRKR